MAGRLPPSQALGLSDRKVSEGRYSTACLHEAQFRFLICNTARFLELIGRFPSSRLHEARFVAANEENFPLTLTDQPLMSQSRR